MHETYTRGPGDFGTKGGESFNQDCSLNRPKNLIRPEETCIYLYRIYMCRQPAIRAPFKGCADAY